jgi:hypothetical protein
MKTFFKTNLIAVFAVLLAVGTMSFKMVEKQRTFTPEWYSVDGSGNIGPSTGTGTPSFPCEENYNLNVCQILLDSSGTIPDTVEEADENELTIRKAGVRH